MSSRPPESPSTPLTHPEEQGRSLSDVITQALARGYVTGTQPGSDPWPLADFARHVDGRILRQRVFVAESPDALYASLMDAEGNVSHDPPLVICTR